MISNVGDGLVDMHRMSVKNIEEHADTNSDENDETYKKAKRAGIKGKMQHKRQNKM